MKKTLLRLYLAAGIGLISQAAISQYQLAPDQNPNFAVSRDRYMQVADSLNEWHSTTQQETYKAIDWLADRKEARINRREFRQQLRRESIRWNNVYYDGYYDYPSYRNRWNNYGGYYQRGYYRRNGSFYINPWGLGYRY